MSAKFVTLRGVSVHNLKSMDLDVPHGKLVVFCGVSGSGKTSLALDTLYAEGQRRYIESFSAYTRQFLQRLEKPAAERIEGIPPAVAVTRQYGGSSSSSRSTVATATEIVDYLRLLFAKIGCVICPQCQRAVSQDTAESAAESLAKLAADSRFMVCFPRPVTDDEDLGTVCASLQEDGFVRAIIDGRIIDLASSTSTEKFDGGSGTEMIYVIVDRLTTATSTSSSGRVRDSLETSFEHGFGQCAVFADQHHPGAVEVTLEARAWFRLAFSIGLRCDQCSIDFPEPEPRLFSFNSPLGACADCKGFGNILDIDMDLVVPDREKTLGEGAIAPWRTPAYVHELEELTALSEEYGIPMDVPYRELTDTQLRLIQEGVPERQFGGLRGFFAWLERRKYKMHLRVFMSRWRSYRLCQTCQGQRLCPEALATQVDGRNIAQVCELSIRDALEFVHNLNLNTWQRKLTHQVTPQILSRLGFLDAVGLGYLTLDRTLRTLSGGEAQRVALTTSLGSCLVNMLYVLDEPSAGLHAVDIERLVDAIRELRDRGNSVVVVEHEESVLRAADQVVEFGPAAGDQGGEVVFQGTPVELEKEGASLTGEYLARRRGHFVPAERRAPQQGCLRLIGARGNNLQLLDVEFPLGLLCLVTGVSGSGKSTLVEETLYPALCRRLGKEAPKPLPFDDLLGTDQVNDVILVDQSPLGRSPRSNPATYIKAFDEIRAVFADTVEARTHNYTAGHFSFNVDGGRCTTCKGDGHLQIDMQFMADVYVKCSQCDGRRYQKAILDVTYRNRSISDVLQMTVREAFSFFRGRRKIQTKLKKLIDVGLDYLCLGQPANTLSAGEAQRLKLAGYLASTRRGRTVFILNEPSTGLHFSDVLKLLDCFGELNQLGHSLIVIEHNLQIMQAADHIIDLGPGAADEGGRVVASGPPERIAEDKNFPTARYLADVLQGPTTPDEY